MRVFTLSLLFSLLCLAFPAVTPAAAGPAGHQHAHDSLDTAQPSAHEDHATTHPSGGGVHDHSAHQWQAPEAEKKRPNPVAASAQSIATGQRIFRHYCITCHGYDADGSGMHGQNLNPKPANLREMAGHHSDGDYHYKIRTGHGPMPHWENTISNQNIWHLVNYLQSLAPEKASTPGHHDHHPPKPAAQKPGHHDHSTHKH